MRKSSKERKEGQGFLETSEQEIIYFGILAEGQRPDLSQTMQGKWSFEVS